MGVMMRRVLTLLLVVVMALTLFSVTPAHSATTLYGTLSPNVNEFRILKGTPGTNLGVIQYTGSVDVGMQWDRCELSYSISGTQSGLTPSVVSANCGRSGTTVNVVVDVKASGVYSGGDFDWYPLSSVEAKLYYNNSLVATVYFNTNPISIREVQVVSVNFGTPPIDTSTVSYTVLPSTSVDVGTVIYITTSADVNVVMTLSDYVSIPATVEFVYFQATPQSQQAREKIIYVTIPTNSLTVDLTIPDASLSFPLSYSVVYNNLTLYSGSLDIPSVAGQVNVGGAIIATSTPLLLWENQQQYSVVSQIYVNQLQGGNLQISMTINNQTIGPVTVTSTGLVDSLKATFPDRPGTIQGQYIIVYNGPYGSAPTVTVRITTSYSGTTGGLLKNVFYILFMMIVSAGFTGVIIGLLLRRPDLQSSGMIMITAGVFIFLIPTLMGYVVALLVHAGIPDPVGVSNLNLMNLGDLVDESIRYIYDKAMLYSGMLFNVAVFTAGMIAVLAAIVIAGGVAGWLTAGALSQFLGQVLGALGSQLLMLATFAFMASIFLKIMAIIFPIVLNVIFVILLFATLIQALFAGFTGSPAQVFGTVISLSILILTILLTPCILASIDQQIPQQKITIPLPPPLQPIEIPDIFSILGLVIIELMILVMILTMAFQRLMATLSGMAGVT